MEAYHAHTPGGSGSAARSERLLSMYRDLPDYLRLPDGSPDYLRLILSAHLYDLVKLTPLQPATRLSARLKCEVLLKREDLQAVFSFKLRGAYNLMRQLDDERKWKGVVACSAGACSVVGSSDRQETMRRALRWPARIFLSPAPL